MYIKRMNIKYASSMVIDEQEKLRCSLIECVKQSPLLSFHIINTLEHLAFQMRLTADGVES